MKEAWSFVKFVAKWAFDPSMKVYTEDDELVDVERFDRRDFWNIFQPDWLRYFGADEPKPCGCQYRKWGSQIIWCLSHTGVED